LQVSNDATNDNDVELIIARERLRTGFFSYLIYVFSRHHPHKHLHDSGYLEAFCYALQQCADGDIRRLSVCMPPRHLKSFTLIVWQSWLLGRQPELQILAVCYGEELARTQSDLFRRIVRSDWYRDIFPDLSIADGADRSGDFQTDTGGYRRSVTIAGPATGYGADIIIADDLMKAQDIYSAAHRQALNRFFDETLLTRFNDPGLGRLVSAQQRLHVEDIVHHIRAMQDVRCIDFPARARCDETFPLFRGREYIRRIGDLLCPDILDEESLREIEQDRQASFLSQYQQAPERLTSSMVDLRKVRFVPSVPAREDMDCVLQFWDTATGASVTSDFSVGMSIGHCNGVWHLFDLVRERFTYPDLYAMALAFAERHRADRVFVENASTGIPLVQDLNRAGHAQFRLREVEGDKLVRLYTQTRFMQSDAFAVLDNELWTPELRREVADFPSGDHDDQVDALSLALGVINSSLGPYEIARARNGGRPPRPSSSARRSRGW
jgi:predicted phage terminase large subunit-like protein